MTAFRPHTDYPILSYRSLSSGLVQPQLDKVCGQFCAEIAYSDYNTVKLELKLGSERFYYYKLIAFYFIIHLDISAQLVTQILVGKLPYLLRPNHRAAKTAVPRQISHFSRHAIIVTIM